MKKSILTLVLAAFCVLTSISAKENQMNKKNEVNKELEKTVCIETTKGVIELKLNPSIAPRACENFINLVKRHYYDGIIFHRVIKDFMLQTGDPTGTGAGGKSCWGEAFEDEFDDDVTFDKVGILAMANSGPHTNGSQFFITTAKTPWLHMSHTIFGEVTKGLTVVKSIEGVKTDYSDKPEEEVKIIKAYIKK
jgi:peptidylprolyl isomerase